MTRNALLTLILEQLGGSIFEGASQNRILEAILLQLDGTVGDESRNGLLESILLSTT